MILADKSLWDKTISSGDPNGFDVTYADRAKKYVTECDRTIDTFILPYFVDEKTIRLRLPMVDSYGDARSREANSRGKPIPWNQQMMLNGGFQRLAICHEMLGDDPQRVASYDTIVRTSIQWCLSEMTRYQVDGHECYKWGYGPENPLRHTENAGHGGYDVLGLCRAYSSGRYGINKDDLLPLCNTLRYVMYKGDGKFATSVDGQGKTSESLGGTYVYLSQVMPDLYPILAPAMTSRAKTRPETDGRLLWTKAERLRATRQ